MLHVFLFGLVGRCFGRGVLDLPRVVPALCIVYWMFLAFFNRRWTAATSFETEAVGVPIGMRQKSVFGVVHFIVNGGLIDGKRNTLMGGLAVCEIRFDCVTGNPFFFFLNGLVWCYSDSGRIVGRHV
jgi:hypothetical protein